MERQRKMRERSAHFYKNVNADVKYNKGSKWHRAEDRRRTRRYGQYIMNAYRMRAFARMQAEKHRDAQQLLTQLSAAKTYRENVMRKSRARVVRSLVVINDQKWNTDAGSSIYF